MKRLSGERAIANTPSCRSGWRLIGCFGIGVVVFSLLLSVLATPWVALPWWKVFRRCVSIAAALSLWGVVTYLQRRRLSSYGFSDWTQGSRQFVFGVSLGAGTLLAWMMIGLLTGACRVEITADQAKLWRTVLGFLPAALIIGVLEELVFRGILLQPLIACSKVVAVSVSSTIYSLVHLKSPTMNLMTGLELGGLFLLGLVLSLSYFRTGQLYCAVGLHAVLAYGARVNKLFLEFPDGSLAWFIGTNRLINGVVSWLGLLGIGVAIVWWTRRSHQGGAHNAEGFS